MPTIRPSSDLRNNYNEISTICHETNKPIYITRNGAGDLAVMSIELYEKLTARYDFYDNMDKEFRTNVMKNTNSVSEKITQQEVKKSSAKILKKEEVESAHDLLQEIEAEPVVKVENKVKIHSGNNTASNKTSEAKQQDRQKHNSTNTVFKKINTEPTKTQHNEVESAHELLQEIEPLVTNNEKNVNSNNAVFRELDTSVKPSVKKETNVAKGVLHQNKSDVKSTPKKDIYNTDWIFEDLNKMLEDIKP